MSRYDHARGYGDCNYEEYEDPEWTLYVNEVRGGTMHTVETLGKLAVAHRLPAAKVEKLRDAYRAARASHDVDKLFAIEDWAKKHFGSLMEP